MNKKKGLILRSIPITKYNYFLEEINKQLNIIGFDLLVQYEIVNQIENKYNLNYIIVKKGKLNLIKGFKYLSIFKYDMVIIPVNAYEIENYVNLLFFVLPIVSKKYCIVYPDLEYRTLNFAEFIFKLLLYFIAEIAVFFILIAVLPFLVINILYNRFRYRFKK